MTDSMGPGKLVRHMQNLSYSYDTYLICMGLRPSISFVIAKSLLNSGLSYSQGAPAWYPNPLAMMEQEWHRLCPRYLYPVLVGEVSCVSGMKVKQMLENGKQCGLGKGIYILLILGKVGGGGGEGGRQE